MRRDGLSIPSFLCRMCRTQPAVVIENKPTVATGTQPAVAMHLSVATEPNPRLPCIHELQREPNRRLPCIYRLQSNPTGSCNASIGCNQTQPAVAMHPRVAIEPNPRLQPLAFYSKKQRLRKTVVLRSLCFFFASAVTLFGAVIRRL
mgnify:CR=1 FL=1